VYWRNRHAGSLGRLQALVVVTLFLTFDLVLFGSFTRLTDSGLGCPDWPGCYGEASPLGAHAEITAAQTAMPTGPVTHGKAWIEMVHRYLATGVGVLIIAMTIAAWRMRKSVPISPWWATATLAWVCIQGAFGALTVTMKLFPAIVTLHLLGAYVLLALLTVQTVWLGQAVRGQTPLPVGRWVRGALTAGIAVVAVQAASGAWVSTNYAVLACTEFPACQGSWWPSMDFAGGFGIWRPLGMNHSGESITFAALTAIHVTHRMLALVTVAYLATLAFFLWRTAALRGPVRLLVGLLALQVATGVSNAVLDWPLVAAVLHTGGAGAMVMVLVWMIGSTARQAKIAA
jgi:cytochrome c oxidase assembly protein subunit 15